MIVHIDKLIRHLRSQIESADKVDSEFVYLTKREAEGCLELAEAQDVIQEMLKEQEAVKPVRDEQTGRIWLCGNCGTYVGFEDNDPYDPNEFDKYCRECGRPVLWEGRRSGNE